MHTSEKLFPDKTVPLFLTFIVFLAGVLLLFAEVFLLNRFSGSPDLIISLLRISDVLVGVTIYLKTSIDFAIFIGRLMEKYAGWKNRVAIEIGTAFGNIAGTLAILILWNLFR